MKTTNLFIVIFLLFFTFYGQAFAQTVGYKDVYITRGDKDPDKCNNCDWTKNCVYITNANKYPVKVRFEYKLNSRDAPWKLYEIKDEVPVSKRQDLDANNTDIPYGMWEYQVVACFNGEIKALRITFIDVIKPPVGL
ncbi:MAG: hypothetical protein LBS46_05825 [Dysgonamonadaceae bacterium]|jgi:hypothetical protein|nr:hypothetical protein [Dysgonamonadaceae bacterium]